MKTIFSNGTYQRVSNEVAASEVSFNRAKYAPKSEWKTNVRDTRVMAIADTVVTADTKGEVTKSKKAEKSSKLKAKQRT